MALQEAVTANAAMPLVAGEDVRTPLGAFRVVFGIGHFDNQINFEAPTIRPSLAKRRCGHRPESPKSAHIARSSFGYGETQRFNHETLLRECRLKLRLTGSLTLIVGGGTMLNTVTFEEGSAEAIARLRKQDDEFCRRLRIAIERGSEFCPTTVNTTPCTSRPILNYTRPD